jgi:hypothetical protein
VGREGLFEFLVCRGERKVPHIESVFHDALVSLMATGWTALLSVRPYPGPQGGLEPTGLLLPRSNSYHRTLTKLKQ